MIEGEVMNRFRTAAISLCVLTLPWTLGGCAVAVIGGLAAAGGAGYAAGQERGVTGLAGDFTTKTEIENAFMRADRYLEGGITTNVYEGRVLLAGRVASPAQKAEAEQIARANPNVRIVYNELEVTPRESFWNDTKDTWISTRIRSQMVLDPAVRSVNYSIATANGSVYLIGSARTQAERDRVLRIARYIPGVRRVVSYIDIRPGEAAAPGYAAASPAAPAGAVPLAPAASGPAAPEAPIQVQKL